MCEEPVCEQVAVAGIPVEEKPELKHSSVPSLLDQLLPVI